MLALPTVVTSIAGPDQVPAEAFAPANLERILALPETHEQHRDEPHPPGPHTSTA